MTSKNELSLDIAMNNLGWARFIDGKPKACGVICPQIPSDAFGKKKNPSVREQNVVLIESLIQQFDELIVSCLPSLVVGEATPGGAKNAAAAVKMNIALTAVLSVCLLRKIPYRWCSPNDVKKATVGDLKASKEQIMDWAIARYGGDKKVREIKIEKGKRAGAITRCLTYEFLNRHWPGGTFEHVADACGAYEAVKNQSTTRPGARGYRNKPRRLGK